MVKSLTRHFLWGKQLWGKNQRSSIAKPGRFHSTRNRPGPGWQMPGMRAGGR